MYFSNANQQVRGTAENAIDFGQSFSMYLSLYGENWADTAMLIDDMEIEYSISGDINGDGYVNADDLAMLRRELLNGASDYNDKFDINGDHAVDIRDLVKLKKLAAE